jgi:hypothetical protein
METIFNLISEVEEAVDYIKSLKDKTLEHYYEDEKVAKSLLIDLNLLEKDANNLLQLYKNNI